MSRDSSVHQLRSVVRRRAPLSFGFRRGRGQLLLPFRGYATLRRGGCRCSGYISDPFTGHGLPQVLPLSAQGAQEEEKRRPKR